MKLKIKEKWVKALRSGKYKQGTKALYQNDSEDGKKGYCCLGVLTHLYAKEKGLSFKEIIKRSGNSMLPRSVQKWAGLEGLDSDNPKVDYKGESCDLAHLNDENRLKFPTIAKLIEKSL